MASHIRRGYLFLAGIVVAPVLMWVVSGAYLARACVGGTTPFGMLAGQLRMVADAAYCPHGSLGLTSQGAAILGAAGAGALLLITIATSLGTWAMLCGVIASSFVEIVAALGARMRLVLNGPVVEVRRVLAFASRGFAVVIARKFSPFTWRAPPVSA